MPTDDPLPLTAWNLGIYDAHCHPTDTMSTTPLIPDMKARTLTIMATRNSDQPLVASLATTHPQRVVPSFGYHPWFSYLVRDDSVTFTDNATHYKGVLTGNPSGELIAALPDPQRLSDVIVQVRSYLEQFPQALVGEIGIDRGFRIPFPEGVDGGDGKRLSPHRVSMEHQKRVFVAQLKLAGELGRGVSVHGVQCHGALFDIFKELWSGFEVEVESWKEIKRRRRRRKGGGGHEYLPDMVDEPGSEEGEGDDENDEYLEGKQEVGEEWKAKPYPPRICLHSFSAPVQTLQQYLAPPSPNKRYPSQVYFSFSSTINARPEKGHMDKIMETIKAVPEDRVLVESDMHTAGDDMDRALEDAIKVIADIRGLGVDYCVQRLADNWKAFIFGGD